VADDFVRVRFLSPLIGGITWRRRPAGKARDRVIETAPPEMHRADFADEARTEFLEDSSIFTSARQNLFAYSAS